MPKSDLTLGGFEDEDADADDEVIRTGEVQSAIKAIGRIPNQHVTSVWKLPTKPNVSLLDAFRAVMRGVPESPSNNC